MNQKTYADIFSASLHIHDRIGRHCITIFPDKSVIISLALAFALRLPETNYWHIGEFLKLNRRIVDKYYALPEEAYDSWTVTPVIAAAKITLYPICLFDYVRKSKERMGEA